MIMYLELSTTIIRIPSPAFRVPSGTMNHRLYVKRSLWGSQRVAEWHIFVDIRPNGQFKSLELVIEDPLTP
jgi:hypothetical protein